MNFLRLGSTEDDQAIADAVARFADETLAPVAQAMDEEAFSATRHVPGLAGLGVMGMNLPESLGGPGVTPTAMLMSLVAISREETASSPAVSPALNAACLPAAAAVLRVPSISGTVSFMRSCGAAPVPLSE